MAIGTETSASAFYRGAEGLRAFRQASAGICEVSALDDAHRFRARSRIHHLGIAVLADVQSSSLRYLRSARQVARAGYDHYQITFNLSGLIHFKSGRQSADVRTGDVIILDGARELDAYVRAPEHGPAHASAVFVPRAALAPLLRVPANAHLLVLKGEQPLAKTLHERLSHMLGMLEIEPGAQARAAVRGLIGLLAGSFGGDRALPLALRRCPHRSTTDSLKRLIERRLDSPALGVELLCAHCGCSRATVYRLFEAEGGPARYIWQRRLQRAFRELICGTEPYRRIAELAHRHRFASEATFNRAFRRTFGIPPGEVRMLAAHSRAEVPAGLAPRLQPRLQGGADAIDWIKALGSGSCGSCA